MAVLYITEYASVGGFNNRGTLAGKEPGTDQTVAITAGSVQSTAFKNNTTYVRLHTDAICSVSVGTNPTATATTRRMAAGQTEYISVDPSSAFKVAVITNT